jgi:predicted HicB family RNase H-like nuclease
MLPMSVKGKARSATKRPRRAPPLSLRMPPEQRRNLEALAARDGRSLSNYVRRELQKVIDRERAQQQTPAIQAA